MAFVRVESAELRIAGRTYKRLQVVEVTDKMARELDASGRAVWLKPHDAPEFRSGAFPRRERRA